jgi:hypothetical protein
MSPGPIPAVPKKRKNLTPEDLRRAAELQRIMSDRRSTLRVIADVAIKLARLEYEKPSAIVIHSNPARLTG